MRVALYTTALSAHQLPVYRLIRDILGAENCRYICVSRDGTSAQTRLGEVDVEWLAASDAAAQDWLDGADVLYVGGMRPLDLFERRAVRGLKTLFQSERWFKPLVLFDLRLFDCLISLSLPGWMRMWVPGYRRMVKRFVRWANGDPNARVLAIGPWAKKDFLRMGVKPEKIEDWGYFVEKGTGIREQGSGFDESNNLKSNNQTILKILWAGRDIPLKHVKDIERAVDLANRRLTESSGDVDASRLPITFTKLTGVSSAEVRKAMRDHDTFVFASDAHEGWGAVVSEALEEGMNVICSSSCGAGPAMLPCERLFKCGDVKSLAGLMEKELHGKLPPCSIGDWTAARAAERLLKLLR